MGKHTGRSWPVLSPRQIAARRCGAPPLTKMAAHSLTAGHGHCHQGALPSGCCLPGSRCQDQTRSPVCNPPTCPQGGLGPGLGASWWLRQVPVRVTRA